MNTEMTFCCMKDCGECSDTSDLCSANRTDAENPHGRESTCCPRAMEGVPSCENSMAPCAVPQSVRNPPDLASLTDADRHAKDDCGDAVKDTRDTQHLSTAFLKFASKEFATKTEHGGCLTTSDCGSYGTLEQAAAACSNNDDCLAFDTDSEGKPDCLIMAEDKIMTLVDGSNDLYLKREFHHTSDTFVIRSVNHKCYRKNPHGALKVKLGFCTSQVAMNELNGAEVYEDLPRAACEPTPTPTPEPTPAPTPHPTQEPGDPTYYSEAYYPSYYYEPFAGHQPPCPADFDFMACHESISGAGYPYYDIAVYWPGDGICDDFMGAACHNDCGDCDR